MRVTGLRITAGSMVLLLDILKVKIVLQDILMNHGILDMLVKNQLKPYIIMVTGYLLRNTLVLIVNIVIR